MSGEGDFEGDFGGDLEPVYSVEFEILFVGAQHSRQRAQSRIELIDGRSGQRQPYRVRRVSGTDCKGRRRRQCDVAAGRGGNECLRPPVRRQCQPQMIGFRIGLDFEAGEPLGCDLLTALRIDRA